MSRADSEIIGYTLETLYNVMSNEPPDDEDEIPVASTMPDELGSQFTEIFVKDEENMGLLLDLLTVSHLLYYSICLT